MNSNKQIIGITGRKFNGKDTIANHLRDRYDYQQIAFAEPLKESCRVLFGFNDEQLYGSLKETSDPNWYNLTPRQVLQYMGTDIMRNQMTNLSKEFEDKFWIKCVENKIKKILSENPNVCIVISDVRFPNEVEMIKKLGGTVIRVKRPNIENNNTFSAHASENMIDELPVDYELINDTTREELYYKTEDIIYSLDSQNNQHMNI